MSEKKDLREVLRKVEAEGELVRITREVDPLDEIPNVVKALSKLPKIPALLFEHVEGYPGMKALAAFFGDRSRVLRSLGLPLDPVDMNSRILEALGQPLLPRIGESGPCKENVRRPPFELGALFFTTKGSHNQKTATIIPWL